MTQGPWIWPLGTLGAFILIAPLLDLDRRYVVVVPAVVWAIRYVIKNPELP